MHLHNTSRYPDEQVACAVEYAMEGVDTGRVAVNVKNYRHAYRGRAYCGVPACSPHSRGGKVDWLITIGIGAQDKFPRDNMVTTVRWVRLREGDLYDPRTARRRQKVVRGVVQRWMEKPVLQRHPYGGKSAPYIELRYWVEALVAVSAHEARHIWQFQTGAPRSEVDCERYAAARLEQFRTDIARAIAVEKEREQLAAAPPPARSPAPPGAGQLILPLSG